MIVIFLIISQCTGETEAYHDMMAENWKTGAARGECC
jgi:hypothetical protein